MILPSCDVSCDLVCSAWQAMVIFGGVEGSTRYQDAWRLPA